MSSETTDPIDVASSRRADDQNPLSDPLARYPADPDLRDALIEGPVANLQRCYRFIGARPGEYVELQALDVPLRPNGFKPNYFAHAANEDEFIRLCALGEGLGLGAPAVYILLNQIDPAVVTRAPVGQWHQQQKDEATSNENIEARRVLYIDIDPDRASGTSSTDDQMNEAHAVGRALADRLSTILGTSDPILRGHSGNGAAVMVALDYLPCTKELTTTIEDILKAIEALHGSKRIKIDRSVLDQKRLAPAFGTLKKKGAPNIPERPHRRSACVCAATVRRIGLSELTKLRDELVASAPKPEARSKPRNTQQTQSSGDTPWKLANALEPRDVCAWLGILDGDVVKCPGCGETKGVDAIDHGLKCHHNRCTNKGRNGFRTNIDLVMEVRKVDAKEAHALLAEQFGLKPLAGKSTRTPITVDPNALDRLPQITNVETAAAALSDQSWLASIVADEGARARVTEALAVYVGKTAINRAFKTAQKTASEEMKATARAEFGRFYADELGDVSPRVDQGSGGLVGVMVTQPSLLRQRG